MKKIHVLLVVSTCIITLAFSSCAQSKQAAVSSQTTANTISVTETAVDKTVKVPLSVEIEGKNILQQGTILDRAVTDSDVSSLTKNAQEVIRGKIKAVTFTAIQGVARIKVDVQVIESLKGNLNKNDIVSIFELGGYIPLKTQIEYFGWQDRFKNLTDKQIDNTVEKYVIDGEAFPQVGEESMFFLKTQGNPLPSGSYIRVGAYTGEFKFVDGKDNIKRYEPSAESPALSAMSIQENTDNSYFKSYSYNDLKLKVTKAK